MLMRCAKSFDEVCSKTAVLLYEFNETIERAFLNYRKMLVATKVLGKKHDKSMDAAFTVSRVS